MSLEFNDQCSECPLCMEPYEMDDLQFFPCTCGYQICRFCWHRIRTDENGLCPACRKQYPEDPADFKPLSVEEWQKIKNEKRQRDQQKKQKLSENRKHLANVRVVQKNLVFVVGLPARLADAEVLKKHDYFGKFGKIHKVVVNQSTSYAGSQGPSASAYVTYCRPEDALRAIKTVNNIQVDGRTLKASLGTTKYCSHFLKNQQCPKTDCMYLHELGDEAASFTKEDMQQGKHQEYERKLQDQILGCNNNNISSRKQAVSPTPQNTNTTSIKDSWPCTLQNVKESRTNRSKDSSQNQRAEGKNGRSKNKHTEGQKSKKSKNKSTDATQNHNSSKHLQKEENSSQKKSQKGKHKDTAIQPLDYSQRRDHSPATPSRDVSEMNSKNAQQTRFVHIEQQAQSKTVSASIKIARSESPVLPASPISSSSSSLFTPFGSLSSNFLSSSSPSPPPSSGNPLAFDTGSPCAQEGSPVTAFVAAAQMEHKRRSPSNMFYAVDGNTDSLFSQLNCIQNAAPLPSSTDCNSYNDHLHTEERTTTDSSDWSSSYSFEDSQKPEDDLDFDPWNESSKGLADLIAKESVHNPSFTEMPTLPGLFPTQIIKPPVPNQQRISIPPPGFCSRQVPPSQTNSLNHLPGIYGPSNSEFLSCKVQQPRPTMNGCNQYFLRDHQQNQIDLANQQYKQQFSHQNSQENILEALRLRKNVEERFRYLIPDMLNQLNSRNLQKSQNQNGPSWNQGRDFSWLANESSSMLNPSSVSEAQRNYAIWMKALQQLSLEDNSNQFSGHSAYPNNFAMRGQWPTAQCPPPGFVTPSRPTVNTPFQHMQVNQKI